MMISKKDFPKRTIDILKRHSSNEKYDVTLLINCLTALKILMAGGLRKNMFEMYPVMLADII